MGDELPPQLIHYFRKPCLSQAQTSALLSRVNEKVSESTLIDSIESEFCYNIQLSSPLTKSETNNLIYLLSETFEPQNFSNRSFLEDEKNGQVIEVGPRMNFTTAWSSNAVAVCKWCNLKKVLRMERSRRYLLRTSSSSPKGLSEKQLSQFAQEIHDRMTECVYPKTCETFATGIKPKGVFEVPVLENGRFAFEEISDELGLGFDEQDIDFYTDLFVNQIKRNPTSVECFDLAQGNSEHSRHWFFGGKMVIDGLVMPNTLFQMVKAPHKENPNNSVIAFSDNSSSQRGCRISTLLPSLPGTACPMTEQSVDYDLTLTAETHNFPTGICPFPGAETGPGGRIRDGHCTGRGSLIVAGMAGYSVGNLCIPGYDLPWENCSWSYPSNMASPLKIIIDASNGASDYGNKFGEPLIQGFTRSFGVLVGEERREWIKPIMFSSGIGQIDHNHSLKTEPKSGMLIIKIGGPAYRIGLGGGAASSMVQGDNKEELDFNAVQRGDAEMEQKMNRVIRSCIEMQEKNPIISIHDQGAGGSGNVLKEISVPAGADIDIRKITSGDDTLSVLELWGAEYQENDALLLAPESLDLFEGICTREQSPFSVVGTISGTGRVVVSDSKDGTTPVDLDLEQVLSNIPQKTFEMETVPLKLNPLVLPEITVKDALNRVLRLISVGSKRFLTTKVDRTVTGLIAQQQCVGPLQLTLADVAVTAQSHFGVTGCATAIGEQPIKGFVDCAAMARLSVAESLTNLVWAKVSSLSDVKASGNWMWAAKLKGEGPLMYEACMAMRDFMIELEIALDGGKDSLSMAARVPIEGSLERETVKGPGTLVISSYVSCPDITLTVTPDLKLPGEGCLLFIDIGRNTRLGGSALAHVYSQIGSKVPDVQSEPLKNAFNAIQHLISTSQISSGHDRSDGGLITTVLEMAFAGNCGIDISVQSDCNDPLAVLFNEEVGLVIEVSSEHQSSVIDTLDQYGVAYQIIGKVTDDTSVKISVNDAVVLIDDMRDLRDIWEETSFELDRLQANHQCVAQEKEGLRVRKSPPFQLTFAPHPTAEGVLNSPDRPRVAVIRQEGSNGDREMASAFHLAGFETWDVTMTDLISENVHLDQFRGVIFVGGFSYADVLDSAKGWAATIKFNKALYESFTDFYNRKDTFSLGVCNGCQLMSVLGWVPCDGPGKLDGESQPRFIRNASERFESRYVALKVEESPAIMLKGMEGSTLPIWCAHGEGRAYFPDSDILSTVINQNLSPLKFVDDSNDPTEKYPFNPNGSPHGIAALCSPDGRHLAMMPHPERVCIKWQMSYTPQEWKNLEASPWIRMFQNAYSWCISAVGAT